MSKIRSKNTNLEIVFLKKLSSYFYKKGYRYRKHYKKLPGSPDIVFVSKKIAIFLDGDFWHGYNFRNLGHKLPRKYWLPKIKRNIQRDKEINLALRGLGWRVLRFWEHQIRKNPERAIRKIEKNLKP